MNLHANDTEEVEDIYRKLFWEKIEKTLCPNIFIPTYIKNIFKFQGLDNPVTFKSISENVLKEVENFVRSDFYKSLIPSDARKRDYYDMYEKEENKFIFPIGHKLLIFKIKEFICQKKDTFWKSLNINKNLGTIQTINEKAMKSVNFKSEAKKIFKLLSKNKKMSVKLKTMIDCVEVEITLDKDSIAANISCSICKKKIRCLKKNGRWDLYNFRRHFMTHTKHNDPKKGKAIKGRKTSRVNLNKKQKKVNDQIVSQQNSSTLTISPASAVPPISSTPSTSFADITDDTSSAAYNTTENSLYNMTVNTVANSKETNNEINSNCSSVIGNALQHLINL